MLVDQAIAQQRHLIVATAVDNRRAPRQVQLVRHLRRESPATSALSCMAGRISNGSPSFAITPSCQRLSRVLKRPLLQALVGSVNDPGAEQLSPDEIPGQHHVVNALE